MSVLKTRFAAAAARRLRTNMSDAERRLWYHLRARRLLGYKFVRQQPVGQFIAGFACREADLIVELDGGQHAEAANLRRDIRRSEVLAEHGYRVIRFWNNDVVTNVEGTLQVIADSLMRAPSPGLRFAKSDLSPKGEVIVQTAQQGTDP